MDMMFHLRLRKSVYQLDFIVDMGIQQSVVFLIFMDTKAYDTRITQNSRV